MTRRTGDTNSNVADTSRAAGITSTTTDDEAQVLAAYRAMYRAMLERDTWRLDELLDPGYTLTHMTGYLQSRAEWLQQIESGQMRYHSATERNTTVQVDGDAAVLVGCSTVDATIWGGRGTWPLQLTTQYERREMGWTAVSTVASTF